MTMQGNSGSRLENAIIMTYAKIIARSEALVRTWGKSNEPRDSVIQKEAMVLRRYLSGLPPAKRQVALDRLSRAIDAIRATERQLGRVCFSMPISEQARPQCPCERGSECELQFQEIGFGPEDDPDPGPRARLEDLAKCPLQQPAPLTLVGVARTEDRHSLLPQEMRAPGAGIVVATDSQGKRRRVARLKGNTFPQLKHQAKHAQYRLSQNGVPRTG